MRSERYQNDRHFVWLFYLTPDRTPYNLEGLDLVLEVQVGLSKTRITDFTVSGNAVDFVFRGRDQKRPGPILATLFINENQDGMVAIDAPAGLMSPHSTPGAPDPGGVETSNGEILSFLGEWVDDRLIPNTIARKSDLAEFVTKMVDDLVNYYTKDETYSRREIEALVAGIQLVPVQVLPEASADTMNKIYLVPSADPKVRNENDEFVTKREGSAGNYIYKWEQIGSTAIDLSGYVTIQALNAALADYTTTSNLTVLLAGKQDAIADLQTIRSGASAGATAYQKPGTGIPKSDLDASAQASLGKADTALQEHQDLTPITDLIPAQASEQNQLADKAFVNSSIGTATATFRGTYNLVSDLHLTTSATREQVATALASEIATADNNDYCFVQNPTADATPSEIARVDRYKFDGTAWAYEWSLNDSSFTASQWAAINSGITAALVSAFGNKYDKPQGGIPKTDLAQGVQNSLGAADTAYQKPGTGIPASDLASGVIPDVSNFITKSVDDLVNYYLKSDTYTKTEVQNLIAAINQFHYEIYASTSAVTDPASNVLYLIGPTGSGADKYEEYVYDSTKQDPWVKIGDTSIDLSGYVTTSALNTALADYTTTANLTTLLAGKQDKIDSTNKLDYSLVDNTPTIPDAVEANPTVPAGTTPTDLIVLKIGNLYFAIPSSGGGDDEAIEVAAAALCDINERMFEKKNLVDTYDQVVAGNHEKVATSFALYKLYFDFLENEEILATALCDLKSLGALATAIAPLYERGTRTFAVDDCCIYDSQFWRCVTAVPTPEPFDSTKWVKTSLFEEMVRRFNAI